MLHPKQLTSVLEVAQLQLVLTAFKTVMKLALIAVALAQIVVVEVVHVLMSLSIATTSKEVGESGMTEALMQEEVSKMLTMLLVETTVSD